MWGLDPDVTTDDFGCTYVLTISITDKSVTKGINIQKHKKLNVQFIYFYYCTVLQCPNKNSFCLRWKWLKNLIRYFEVWTLFSNYIIKIFFFLNSLWILCVGCPVDYWKEPNIFDRKESNTFDNKLDLKIKVLYLLKNMIDVNERLNRPKSGEPSSGQHFNTMGPPRNFLDIVYKTTMLLKNCTNGFNP